MALRSVVVLAQAEGAAAARSVDLIPVTALLRPGAVALQADRAASPGAVKGAAGMVVTIKVNAEEAAVAARNAPTLTATALAVAIL